MECPLEITVDDYRQIEKCEAVVIREFERLDESRFAIAAAWGDFEEMNDQCETNGLLVVKNGVKFICQKVVLVKSLLNESV